MKIFTNEVLRTVDAKTIESGDATALQLIEQVAEGAVREILQLYNGTKPTVVFAGPGNNGADALAVARLLIDNGFSPEVYLFNIGGNRLSPECRTERDMLLSVCPDVHFTEIVNQLSLPELSRRWLVVDGLFGSGLREGLSGGFVALVRRINESGATVVSIDVPSGLHGDWNHNTTHRDVIHARLTLTVGMPRISFFMPENAPLVGEWKVIPIAFNREALQNAASQYYYVERADVKPLLPRRDPFASKADFGSALIVGGSYGMAGAAVLAARAALRAGAGKVSVFGPRCNCAVAQTSAPEAMYVSDKNDTTITSVELRHDYNAFGVGPGLGTSDATINALEAFMKKHKRPMVLDADALNCIALRPQLLNFIPRMSVLTPHTGEFDRLFGPQPSTAEGRLLKAQEMARRYEVVIVMKGRYTATVRPDGKTYFNSSGTPAMATAGSGDVLTGIITSFMAQGMNPAVAAVTGVYVHGVAGEMACAEHGEYGVTAGDIASFAGRAIEDIIK